MYTDTIHVDLDLEQTRIVLLLGTLMALVLLVRVSMTSWSDAGSTYSDLASHTLRRLPRSSLHQEPA